MSSGNAFHGNPPQLRTMQNTFKDILAATDEASDFAHREAATYQAWPGNGDDVARQTRPQWNKSVKSCQETIDGLGAVINAVVKALEENFLEVQKPPVSALEAFGRLQAEQDGLGGGGGKR
ncbi:hypothetical protein ACWDG1_49425 [Streptomyces sp. NPDC001177]